MNIKKRFIFWCATLVAGVLMLGGLSVWNLASLWRAANASTSEYSAMDRADATAVQATWLRDALRGVDGQTYRDTAYFAPIQTELRQIITELEVASRLDDGDVAQELKIARTASDDLIAAANQVSTRPPAATAAQVDRVRQSLATIARLVPGSARRHVAAAGSQLLSRLEWTCGMLFIILAISAAIHFTQYRALVRPLVGLRESMRHSAALGHRDRIQVVGPREFTDVAGFFNGLAGELANLYRTLEEKVIAKSRELVRSERLASVGFLAAGVAHEINNPLSVISGYAELAAKSLRRIMNSDNDSVTEDDAEGHASALEAQEIIREEAFRCKEITSRLLSLARGGTADRQRLNLAALARQVTILTKGLRNYRDRNVVLDLSDADPLDVVANPTEMKQVLLNLTVNALEAVAPTVGEVRIGGRRTGQWVEVFVQDNGKGMSAETVEQVFEPFFTVKRGAGEPGTGLGLSITHAIIENHGGRIRAESAGPGRGSRFTVSLPVGDRAAASSSLAVSR